MAVVVVSDFPSNIRWSICGQREDGQLFIVAVVNVFPGGHHQVFFLIETDSALPLDSGRDWTGAFIHSSGDLRFPLDSDHLATATDFKLVVNLRKCFYVTSDSIQAVVDEVTLRLGRRSQTLYGGPFVRYIAHQDSLYPIGNVVVDFKCPYGIPKNDVICAGEKSPFALHFIIECACNKTRYHSRTSEPWVCSSNHICYWRIPPSELEEHIVEGAMRLFD